MINKKDCEIFCDNSLNNKEERKLIIMYDPTICRQVYNVGVSVSTMKKRDAQFRRAARKCQNRMRKYVMNKELGLALLEAETAAQKLELAMKYKAVADKLKRISNKLCKAEACNAFDEDLSRMINLLDISVRSMNIDKMERAVQIYEKYFEAIDEKELGGGEGKDWNEEEEETESPARKSKAEEMLEKIVREVSRKGTGSSQPVVIPALAMNLAKKERPRVAEIIRQLEEDHDNHLHIDLIASSLLKKSSIYLPEMDI